MASISNSDPGQVRLFRRRLAGCVVLGILTLAGCRPHKINTVPEYVNPDYQTPYYTPYLSPYITPASPPPTPFTTFSASPQTIERGQSSTLIWTTKYANEVTIDGSPTILNGSLNVSPPQTRIYHLAATGPGGTTDQIAMVTVTDPRPPPAPIVILESPPQLQAQTDTSTTRVKVIGPARSVRQSAGSGSVTDSGAALEREIQDLPPGNVVFQHPDEMQVQRAETIRVVISGSLEGNLAGNLPVTGAVGQVERIEQQTIKISETMKVRMSGEPYFKVTPLSNEEQPVTPHTSTEWAFSVLPLQAGTWKLHLTIEAVLHSGGGQARTKDYPVQDKLIVVRVSWTDATRGFVVRNWKWLWTTLLLPLGVWAANKWRQRRDTASVSGKAKTRKNVK